MSQELADRMDSALKGIREITREYFFLGEEQRKATRAMLYRKSGNFGKLLVPFMDQVTELENQVADKKAATNKA